VSTTLLRLRTKWLAADGCRVIERPLEPGHLGPVSAQRPGRHVQAGDAKVRIVQRDGAPVALAR
jgi:hypothetical protein